MRRSAIEAAQRGVSNLLANWQLVLVQLLQTLVVTILVVAGAVPFVLVIGVGTFRSLMGGDLSWSGGGPQAAEELLETLTGLTWSLLGATLVAGVVWTIAVVVYSYFQAGIFGVLAEGDQRAATGEARGGFRAFSGSLFRAAADRGLWTFFWLINLFMLVGTLLALSVAVIAAIPAFLMAQESAGAAAALGCAGVVIVGALAAGLGVWFQLALAAAVSGAPGLWRATRAGLKVLFRRLGAVVVLTLLAVVIGLSAALVFVPLGLVIDLAVGDSLVAYLSAQLVLSAVQSVVSAIIGIGLAGTLVALVRGELALGGVGAE